MLLKQTLLVALALTMSPTFGCDERSNTVIQNQPKRLGTVRELGAGQGSETNPNLPNPTHAGSGEPMSPAAYAPGALDNAPIQRRERTGGAAARSARPQR